MTSDRQFRLLPKRGDEPRAALHRPESIAGEAADLADRGGTQVRDLAAFQMRPDVFDGVQFRGVGRQLLEHDALIERLDVLPHQATAVGGQAIPDDEQLVADLLG
jgi:hypothetical protein